MQLADTQFRTKSCGYLPQAYSQLDLHRPRGAGGHTRKKARPQGLERRGRQGPQFKVLASTNAGNDDLKASLKRRLAEIHRGIQTATEQQYLAGLEVSATRWSSLTTPVMEPQAEEMAPPEQDEESGEVIEPLIPRADLEGVRAEGNGREVVLQAFNWESNQENWWQKLIPQAQRFADLGFTVVWLPPPTTSVAPQGYMPLDYYNLNSAYGSEGDLRKCIKALQKVGLKVLCDCVLNHRCASAQDERGIWNRFGGKMDWDARAICGDDQNFGGRGGPSSGDIFHAAPNVDHTQTFVKADLCQWLLWLKEHIGYDGWRFDFVRGFSGRHVADYVAASRPTFVIGEYWDSLAYDGSVPKRNQDAHRQRTVNWLNSAQGGATAFDVTTKGILHAVFERTEYWRLKDKKGHPPGLMGWWPSRSVTFLENHDTGSTQGHWRFPARHLEEGHAYILTHPSTPSIFLDHIDGPKLEPVIRQLIAIRSKAGIHCRSKVTILLAEKDVYAASVDDVLLMKIGPGKFDPPSGDWAEEASGKRWRVWLKKQG